MVFYYNVIFADPTHQRLKEGFFNGNGTNHQSIMNQE